MNEKIKSKAVSISVFVGLFFSFNLLLGAGIYAERIENVFLFCLQPSIEPMQIDRSGDEIIVDIPELNSFFQKNEIQNIERWIPHAQPIDHDGNIYLNRIYRVYLSEERTSEMPEIKHQITGFDFILSSEFEYLDKPLYQPNDPSYWQQCSLPAVNADQAWGFWEIANGIMPGDREVIVASVDTAIDYTHPDLQDNAWINQGEIPSYLISAVDDNDDGYVSSVEIVAYLEENSLDANNDGVINLRDALDSDSPFANGSDDDWNSYTDDLIGWDCSGWSGADDNDPYPKEDQAGDSGWAHGTHVAGILAATSNNGIGIASTGFNISLMSVKVSRESTSQDPPPVNDGYAGITYAARAGHDSGTFTILNLSWGYSGGYNSYNQSVINNAHNTYGAVIVAAGGNGDDYGNDEYSSHYPSSYSNVISVAVVDCNGEWGGWGTYHETIDLSAPGGDIFNSSQEILSTGIGGVYFTSSGSSMASPNAASCIGLLKAFYPDWTNVQLEERIIESADPFIYEVNEDDYLQGCLGAGMVDVYTAIGALVFPSLSYQGHSINFMSGDDDSILNPGESAELFVTLGNQENWVDASNISVTLTCDNVGVTITDDLALYNDIAAGDFESNMSDPFSFELSESTILGQVDFILNVEATGVDGYSFVREIHCPIEVSLNQEGWPIDSLLASLNNVETAPIISNILGDSAKEIIFGDYSGYLFVVNSAGEMIENELFPFDTGDQIWGSPASADIDNDGHKELVITSKSKHLYILDPIDNVVQVDYDANQFLMGTPAIGNIDDDDELEIIFGGFDSSGKIFAINPDGTDVTGFPYELGEKMRRGLAIADFNGNDKVDIVCATESDDNIWLIYDDGTAADGFPFTAGDQFRSAPTILEHNAEKIIFAGSRDFNFYAINSDGSLRFEILTGNYVNTSSLFVPTDDAFGIFFGSEDGLIYGVDVDGNNLSGWPIDVGAAVNTSPVAADLDDDGEIEIIAANTGGQLFAYRIDGSVCNGFPINCGISINSSPTIKDTDGDGDLEILIGTIQSMINIDYKQIGSVDELWNTHRGNRRRTGFSGDVESSSCGGCEFGDVNCDGIIDILDIVRVVNIVLTSEATECELYLADINQDVVVDILDIVTIVNLILGN